MLEKFSSNHVLKVFKIVPVKSLESINYPTKEYYDHQHDRSEYHYYRLDPKPEPKIRVVESCLSIWVGIEPSVWLFEWNSEKYDQAAKWGSSWSSQAARDIKERSAQSMMRTIELIKFWRKFSPKNFNQDQWFQWFLWRQFFDSYSLCKWYWV